MVSEPDEANLQMKDWMSQLRELAYDVEEFIEILFMHHLSSDETCDGFINKIKINTLKAPRHISNQDSELKERQRRTSSPHRAGCLPQH